MATKYGAYWGSRQTLARGSSGGSVFDLYSAIGNYNTAGLQHRTEILARGAGLATVVYESDTVARSPSSLIGASGIPFGYNIISFTAATLPSGFYDNREIDGLEIWFFVVKNNANQTRLYAGGGGQSGRTTARQISLSNEPRMGTRFYGVAAARTGNVLYISAKEPATGGSRIWAFTIPFSTVVIPRTPHVPGQFSQFDVTFTQSFARAPGRDYIFTDGDNVGDIYEGNATLILARSLPHPRINQYSGAGAPLPAASFDIDGTVESPTGVTLGQRLRVPGGAPGGGNADYQQLAVLDGDSIRYFILDNINIPEYSPRQDPTYLELYAGTRHVYTFPAISVTPQKGFPVTYAARGLPQDSTYDPTTHTVTVDGTDEAPGTIGLMVETATAISGTASFTKPYRVHAQTAAKWSTPSVSVEFQKGVDLGAQALGAMLAGGPQPTVTVVGALPAGVTFDTALLRFNPGAASIEGNGSFVLRAVNALGSDNLTVNWRVYGTTAEPTWTVTDVPLQEFVQNRTGQRYVVPNPGGLNPAPIFTARGVPAGMTFNPVTRAIEDVSPATGPTDISDGTAIITATQTPIGGGDPLVIEYQVPWRVAAAVAPKWNATALREVIATFQYRSVVHLPIVDEGFPTPQYSVAGGPAGMPLEYDSGKLALDGEPTANNTQGTATITAREGTSTDTITLPWKVRSYDTTGSDQEWFATVAS